MILASYRYLGIAALAFASVVPHVAGGQTISPSTIHPLLGVGAGNSMVISAKLSKAVPEIAKTDSAGFRVTAFYGELERVLSENREKPRTVVYPNNPIIGQLSIFAIVPPTGMESMPIGVCLQQGIVPAGKNDADMLHTNIGTLQIQPDGKIVPQSWNGVKVGGNDASGKFQAACAPYRSAYIQFINEARKTQTPEAK